MIIPLQGVTKLVKNVFTWIELQHAVQCGLVSQAGFTACTNYSVAKATLFLVPRIVS